MAKSDNVIGYTADAAMWCPDCAEREYPGCTDGDTVVEDGEGNEVHPSFAGDEAGDGGDYCGSCGECIREPAEQEGNEEDEDEAEPVCLCEECRDALVEASNNGVEPDIAYEYDIEDSVLSGLVVEREARLRCDCCGYHEWGDIWYVSPA
jgi:hypothetical protein